VQVQIKPGLRRAWRGPGTVQIGLDPRRGTVLDGLTDADRELLDRLGTGLDEKALPAGPANGTDRTRQLLRLLADAGVLVQTRAGRAALSRLGAAHGRLAPDAAVWSVVHRDAGDGWELLARRAGRRIEVVGAGRTGTGIATTLAASGVGRVQVRDPRPVTDGDIAPYGAGRSEVGLPREEAARLAIQRTGRPGPTPPGGPAVPGRGTPAAPGRDGRAVPGHAVPDRGRDTPGRPDPPTPVPELVVVVEETVADAAAADTLLAADVPHLSVVIGEAGATVGPLVLPGRGPCLRCLELHRADRDPAWPRLLAQLLTERHGSPPEETGCAGLTAALAALQVLTLIDGHRAPACLGATLEVELPDGLISRREWPAHPACGCHWPPAAPARSYPVPLPSTARAGAPVVRAGRMPV